MDNFGYICVIRNLLQQNIPRLCHSSYRNAKYKRSTNFLTLEKPTVKITALITTEKVWWGIKLGFKRNPWTIWVYSDRRSSKLHKSTKIIYGFLKKPKFIISQTFFTKFETESNMSTLASFHFEFLTEPMDKLDRFMQFRSSFIRIYLALFLQKLKK